MSVYSARTGLTSILKNYSHVQREKAKLAAINTVRFVVPRGKGLHEAVQHANERNSFAQLNEYAAYVKESSINDADFIRIMNDAHSVVCHLGPKLYVLIEALLSVDWIDRSPEAVQAYTNFIIELLVAQINYTNLVISQLIKLWIPKDEHAHLWENGEPTEEIKVKLQTVHNLLERILSVVPISIEIVLENIEATFPYYKRPNHMTCAFVHNALLLLDYKPIAIEFIMQLLFQKLILLDVNAPRDEIEETEEDEEEMRQDDEEMFKMDDQQQTGNGEREIRPMNHPIANTLDICMEKMFTFLDGFRLKACDNGVEKQAALTRTLQFQKILLRTFANTILPCHNTHHVQFIMFYFANFKTTFAEKFLEFLWNKFKELNESAVIRQATVGYIASFLARSKMLPLTILRNYLKELCDWAHQYIQRSDQYQSNASLKANLVFFSVCQAVFYVIAFRSRDLTANKESLMFLQSLQLSALVTCNFNPLRVCLPTVVTVFAGVTRAYQLAYCHAILERNARRKLATVYANDMATPEETLDTFFPFDPYMLRRSGTRINCNYLQYQPNDSCDEDANTSNGSASRIRKHYDSEKGDDVDDFLLSDKRQKLIDAARSHEAQFTYGLSPGFHT